MMDSAEQKQKVIKSTLQKLTISDERLNAVKERMSQALSKGLTLKLREESSLKMLPTYVRDTPDGSEVGDFLALDLGGTNFRVLRVQISKEDGGMVHMDNQVYKMPAEVMTGSGEELFDYIAESIGNFLEVYDLKDVKLPLGFTFSFPCKQDGLDRGTLIRWTKGFSASGVVGEDVVQLLQDAVSRMEEEYQLEVVALVNDTVGTLMSCGHEDHESVVGMIVGTGTNACYMETLANVEALPEEERQGGGQMCINTEWGAFGECGELDDIITEYDRAVDERSINPGCMLYEKMISGMYMGEVVRNILVDLVNSGSILGGHLSEQLGTFGHFETAFVTQIELDHTPVRRMAAQILRHLGYESEDLKMPPCAPGQVMTGKCKLADRQAIREVCETVSTRSAHLCASGVSALLERIIKNRQASGEDMTKNMTVGVDGTVYKKHPHFRRLLESKVRDLLPDDARLTFRMSHDGSGKGAALVTAVACRISRQTPHQMPPINTHLTP